MSWAWILLALPLLLLLIPDPLSPKERKKRQEKRLKELEHESLQETYRRVQEADYTINTNAGSICGVLPSVKTQEDADRLLENILRRIDDK